MVHLLHRLYGVDAPVQLYLGLPAANLGASVTASVHPRRMQLTPTPNSLRRRDNELIPTSADSTDSADCLAILPSISVCYVLVFLFSSFQLLVPCGRLS